MHPGATTEHLLSWSELVFSILFQSAKPQTLQNFHELANDGLRAAIPLSCFAILVVVSLYRIQGPREAKSIPPGGSE